MLKAKQLSCRYDFATFYLKADNYTIQEAEPLFVIYIHFK